MVPSPSKARNPRSALRRRRKDSRSSPVSGPLIASLASLRHAAPTGSGEGAVGRMQHPLASRLGPREFARHLSPIIRAGTSPTRLIAHLTRLRARRWPFHHRSESDVMISRWLPVLRLPGTRSVRWRSGGACGPDRSSMPPGNVRGEARRCGAEQAPPAGVLATATGVAMAMASMVSAPRRSSAPESRSIRMESVS